MKSRAVSALTTVLECRGLRGEGAGRNGAGRWEWSGSVTVLCSLNLPSWSLLPPCH